MQPEALFIMGLLTLFLLGGILIGFFYDLRRERPTDIRFGPGMASIRSPSGSVVMEKCRGGRVLGDCYELWTSIGKIYAPHQWTLYKEDDR